MSKFLRSMLCLLPLVACTQYRHIEPTTAAGEACVSSCRSNRFECMEVVNAEHRSCEALRAPEVIHQRDCERIPRNLRAPCQQPRNCSLSEYRCSGPYDRCFVACGGRIEAIN